MNRTAFSLPAKSEYRTRGGLAVTRSVEQFSGDAKRLDDLIDLLDRRRGVRAFPAEEARAFGLRTVDHDALFAIVHPERQQRVAALYRLQPDQASAELPPVVERARSEPDISQSLQ